MIARLPELPTDTGNINQITKFIEKHGYSDHIASPNLAEYLHRLTTKLNEVIDHLNNTVIKRPSEASE
jgi:hypothetical protein